VCGCGAAAVTQKKKMAKFLRKFIKISGKKQSRTLEIPRKISNKKLKKKGPRKGKKISQKVGKTQKFSKNLEHLEKHRIISNSPKKI